MTSHRLVRFALLDHFPRQAAQVSVLPDEIIQIQANSSEADRIGKVARIMSYRQQILDSS